MADTDFLHVIFGAGKYEDISPPPAETYTTDMEDIARTSIYNLKDLVRHQASSSGWRAAGFNIEVNPAPQATALARHIIAPPKSGDEPCMIKDDITRDQEQLPAAFETVKRQTIPAELHLDLQAPAKSDADIAGNVWCEGPDCRGLL
jgi:hypothetical protein